MQEKVKKRRLTIVKEDPDKFIFRPNDDGKLRWDMIVMVGAIINCFSIPLQVSFDPPEMENITYRIVSYSIDFLFFMDMFINFRTAYVNDMGDEVTNGRSIACNYLAFYFWMDLVATVPIDDVAGAFSTNPKNQEIFRLFGVLKLGRLLKLKKIISYLNVPDETK